MDTPWPEDLVPPPIPPPEEIRKILAKRVDEYRLSPGIAVETSEAGARHFVAYGHRDLGTRAPVTRDTIFEIGSITKLFTSLLLADMVHRGEVSLHDPVRLYLPPEVRVPERDGREITLAHLATHTSGLPRMPGNFGPSDPRNPFSDYTAKHLYEFLDGHVLTRMIGEHQLYSNLGFMLLGHALMRRTNTSYDELVRTRICAPLGLTTTAIALPPALVKELASGHDDSFDVVPSWDLRPLPGAGGLRSNTADVVTFMEAFGTESALSDAIEIMKAPREGTDRKGLGKVGKTPDGLSIITHEGGTGGFRTYAGYLLEWKRASVVLTNSKAGAPGDLGRHLLDARRPTNWFRREAAVNPDVFERYVGRYRMSPTFMFTVTRRGDRLYVQATAQDALRVFPASETHFFSKVVPAQITFELGEQGHAERLVLHQNGLDQVAEQIE